MRFAAPTLAALVLSPEAAGADPGFYTQYACHFADGSVAPTNGFVVEQVGSALAEDRCASGGGLTIVLPTTSAPASALGTFRYAIPDGTSVERVSYVRKVKNVGSDSDQSTRVFKGLGTDRCGWYGQCLEEVKSVTVEQPAAPIEFHAYCEYEPCHGPEPGDGLVSVDQIAITLRDAKSPVMTRPPGGDLLIREPVSGTRSVTISAHDEGGGIYQAALDIDGVEQPRQTLDSNGGACAAPFTQPVPCKSNVEGTISLDTTTLADGVHDLALSVYDATGTNGVTFGPVTVSIDNHPDPSAPEVTASDAPPTTAFAGLRLVMSDRLDRRVLSHRRDRPLTLRGQIVDGTGAGLGGAALSIYAARVPAAEKRIGTLMTRPDGTFVFRMRPRVNQRLSIRYGSDPTLVPMWSTALEIPAPILLEPSRDRLVNGQKLFLTAYLLNAKVAARSADVAFQVRIGHQWRTFATRPIDSNGRARVGHRFRVTYRRMTYRFRAVIVRHRDFPFANAVSPRVAVRVN